MCFDKLMLQYIAHCLHTNKRSLLAVWVVVAQASEPKMLVVPKSPPASTAHRVTTSLVADFLQRGNYAYSLSIFLVRALFLEG